MPLHVRDKNELHELRVELTAALGRLDEFENKGFSAQTRDRIDALERQAHHQLEQVKRMREDLG